MIEQIGFIVIDGRGGLFAVHNGQFSSIQNKFVYDAINYRRGSLTIRKFSEIREEKRQKYIKTISELATRYFIGNFDFDVKKIVIGCSGDFKTLLQQENLFNEKLTILKIFDVSYGGENGFHQLKEQFKFYYPNIFDELKKFNTIETQKQNEKDYNDQIERIEKSVTYIDSCLAYTEGYIVGTRTSLKECKYDNTIDNLDAMIDTLKQLKAQIIYGGIP